MALFGALIGFAVPAAAQEVNSGHVRAELVAQSAWAPPGGTIYVALRQKIDRGWHTYWRNSGDAGEATRIGWTLPAGWRAGGIVWATPQRLPLKTLMDYGYTGEVLLPVAITVPTSARPGQTVVLKAAVSFLVCADLCVPEDALLSIPIKVAAGTPGPDLRWGRAVDRALANAPKLAGLKAVMARQGGSLKIAVTGAALKGASLTGAYFYPYSATVIEHAQPQRIERGPAGLTLTLVPGYDFTKGKPPASVSGVLALGDRAFEITARPGTLPTAARGLGPVAGADLRQGSGGPPGGGLGLPVALGFALVGGLILNLMPCVFPVLSMKAAALVRHAHHPRAAKAHGLAFLAGVLATFMLLAGALIAAQSAGAAAGWGFQLQSPVVVGALSLVMMLVALNLLGLFEVGASLQGAGGGLASRSGLAGSAFTGALAVVVAAPCTAPFMAGALGFALTQSPMVALLVFLALGLGFAAPFTLLAFAPSLLRRLPKPGPWMVVLRRILALPMLIAAVWLGWVFGRQAGQPALGLLAGAAAVVVVGAWLVGRGQRRERWSPWFSGAVASTAVAAVALLAVAVRAPQPTPAEVAAIGYEAFTPERLDALRGAGHPVLVNFTAAWCVTCQVNERLALSTRPVADAMRRSGVAYLKADWTNRDAVIAQVLAEHGRAGVPLYLLYGKGGREAVELPQLLTEGEVVSALEAAARPAA